MIELAFAVMFVLITALFFWTCYLAGRIKAREEVSAATTKLCTQLNESVDYLYSMHKSEIESQNQRPLCRSQ